MDESDRHFPNDIIEFIISKLRTTEDTVQTCVLSKDFRFLWTKKTSIDVDISRKGNPDQRKVAEFKKFVHRVLQNSVSNLESFHLSCSDFYTRETLCSWIDCALNKNVKVLDLTFSVGDKEKEYVKLPESLAKSNSLEVLRLNLSSSPLLLSMCFELKSLKKLELNAVKIQSNQTATTFFWNCKVLEELILTNCVIGSLQYFDISCPLLKKLSYQNVGPCEMLFLDCPKLKALEFQGEAHVQWFDGSKFSTSLPTLKTLELTLDELTNFDVVFRFLKCSSSLESLYLIFHESFSDEEIKIMVQDQIEKARKMNRHLKTVRVRTVVGRPRMASLYSDSPSPRKV